MSVVLSLEDVGPCRKQLTIEIPAPAVEAETERVVKDFSSQARIPGFRKGKVPQQVVRKRFAEDIEKEVVERLLPRYWKQAQAEKGIEPLLSPEIASLDPIKPGEPLTFKATVEVRPDVELGNLVGFDIPDPSGDPSPMEIEEALDQLRRRFSDWIAVDRPAVRGDMARGKIVEIVAEGDAPEPQPFAVEIGDSQVWEELTLALTGLTAGREARFEHTEAPQNEGEVPRTRKFEITVEAIEERLLPELDDAFAAKVNPSFDAFEELRGAIVDRLTAEKMRARRDARERALLDQLRERYPIELPPGVVRQETENLMRDYAETLHRSGVNLDQANLDWHRIGHDMEPAAQKRVHARLLLDAVAARESVSVTEDEFERALAALARGQGTTTPALRKALDEDGRLANLRLQLRRDKTIRRLLGETEEFGAVAAE